MALQNTGPISCSDIQAEYGGTSPISLSEYYNRANAPVSSGPISMGLHFYGTGITFDLALTVYTPWVNDNTYFEVTAHLTLDPTSIQPNTINGFQFNFIQYRDFNQGSGILITIEIIGVAPQNLFEYAYHSSLGYLYTNNLYSYSTSTGNTIYQWRQAASVADWRTGTPTTITIE